MKIYYNFQFCFLMNSLWLRIIVGIFKYNADIGNPKNAAQPFITRISPIPLKGRVIISGLKEMNFTICITK